MLDIETVWTRIRKHEGEEFRKKRGGVFTYKVDGVRAWIFGDSITKPFTFNKSEVQKGLECVPCAGPGVMKKHGVFNASHVWAVLHDSRICP